LEAFDSKNLKESNVPFAERLRSFHRGEKIKNPEPSATLHFTFNCEVFHDCIKN